VRKSEDYLNLSRQPVVNHLKTEIKKSRDKSSFYKTRDFVTSHMWTWIYHYVKSRFGARHPYPAYLPPDTGVYRMEKGGDQADRVDQMDQTDRADRTDKMDRGVQTDDRTAQMDQADGARGDEAGLIKVCIVSDWATGTPEAREIAHSMKSQGPDYTIHMGDTYYVGAPQEIDANFGDGNWPIGNAGSFALLGNHEMYSRGVAFFEKLLPRLGLRTGAGRYGGQQAGFFCLENEHWRILGLDTGYHSISRIPILEMVSWWAGNCRLDDILMSWLRDVVKLGDPADKRGLLILTHHQYITGFDQESEYQTAASQLATLIGKDRPVVWLWGHEHKLSVFGRAQEADGITAYGRCIGHGGMPVQIASGEFSPSSRKKGFDKLVGYDKRQKGTVQGHRVGHNGYVLAKIKGEELILEYRDERHELFSEIWKVDKDGHITGTIRSSGELTLLPGKTIGDAVR
jgi:hypothetical protein